MKSIEQCMKQIIQSGTGNVLAIEPTQSMQKELEQNDAITVCDVLNHPKKEQGTKKAFFQKEKTFHFKKMRKTFKKKKKDMILGDIKELENHLKTFIRDSIYITKGTIYLYTWDETYDFDLLIKRYQRYSVMCKLEQCKDGSILIIPVQNTKNHYIQEKLYYVIDTIIDIIDIIGDALAS